MIIQGKEVNRSVTETADVCIVGSGAAGAILAWEMAELGRTVVLLEKGKTWFVTENAVVPADTG